MCIRDRFFTAQSIQDMSSFFVFSFSFCIPWYLQRPATGRFSRLSFTLDVYKRQEEIMCKVISVVNQKGGVGKTTTTVNVGIGLAREGKKVLLIDADPQGSLTASLGYEEPDDLRITLATIMMDVINEEEISLKDGILHHQENVDLLPANIELSALEVTMGNVMSREMIMKEYIDAIRCRYDYILIDCMPSLGMMTINALVSSDSVLILSLIHIYMQEHFWESKTKTSNIIWRCESLMKN